MRSGMHLSITEKRLRAALQYDFAADVATVELFKRIFGTRANKLSFREMISSPLPHRPLEEATRARREQAF